MTSTSDQRRQELWDRAERMRMGFEAMRHSRAALAYIRAEAARTLPATALAWFNPADFIVFESGRDPLPRRAPADRDPRFDSVTVRA